MESYEQFYSRTLNTLRPRACSTAAKQQRALSDTHCSTAAQQQRTLSDIHFHGRRLLEPVLSEELRVQMAEDRRTAVDRDRRRRTRHTDALLQRVQDILNNIHLKNTQSESDSGVTSTSDPSPSLGSETSPIRMRPSTAPAQNQNQNLSPGSSLKKETLRLLNQRMENLVSDESSAGSDPESPDFSHSLTGSYAQLPGPQPSLSPITHRARRPQNILISCPVSESELRANASECLSGGRNDQQSVITASSSAPSGAEWNCSCSEFSDRQLSIITSTPSSISSRKEVTSAAQDVSREKTRPAPLNRSYDVESPSPSLIRPQVESIGPIRVNATDTLQDEMEVEEQIQALENLEREHAHQISELLAAQERQTQELQKKLNEHSRKSMMSSGPELSRSPAAQINTRQDVCVDQTKTLCRLAAVARGFLTRRLLQTEKITHLRKTVQDSRVFIRSIHTDSQLKRVSVSHQDLTLQQRVTAQLRSALHDIHQIFFVWPLRDRLNLLQQDRERRRERTLREMERDSPGNSRPLSSATQKMLERKAQRQANKMNVIPKRSPARILQPRLSQTTVCSSQNVLKKRDVCVGVRQRSLQRKHLSLG
ncbi:centriolar coiled-coil protein of 110 kDa [Pseudorasbora parva]|uniref:centriolar coiled-coil protein of 110 kDa n=1 Tax=Pseudorasbora parva TaxID=51549 RepID=UPI00351EB07D